MKEQENGAKPTTVARSCLEPSFWGEVAPYYMPSYVFVVSHLVYFWTGNLLIPIWLAYILNIPFFY
jgi:hypothetical protein